MLIASVESQTSGYAIARARTTSSGRPSSGTTRAMNCAVCGSPP